MTPLESSASSGSAAESAPEAAAASDYFRGLLGKIPSVHVCFLGRVDAVAVLGAKGCPAD